MLDSMGPGARIVPAEVLLVIRDRGNPSLKDLQQHFKIGRTSNFFEGANRLISIVKALEQAGLVTCTGPEPSRAWFMRSDESEKIAFRALPRLQDIQSALELSLSSLAKEQSTKGGDMERALLEARERARQVVPTTAPYREDFVQTLGELEACLGSESYVAVLCLAGKCLELALKLRFHERGIVVDEGLGLGRLIAKLREVPDEYVDPGLGNVANVINQSRIPAVHAKQAVPIPSREQAMMVVNAVLDFLKRTVLSERAS
jgi:hypothetical protein